MDAHSLPTLVFVYHADSGLFNTVADMAHKLFSPETYQCNLCAITHGQFGMRAAWRDYLAGLGLPLEFLHRDELHDRYGLPDLPLPAILLRRGHELELLVPAAAISACTDSADLQACITAALAARGLTGKNGCSVSPPSA